jgi:NAD(P)H-hydrate repair Nnr-like enzyme with NAD(P)H-hydrate dehydratase domain
MTPLPAADAALASGCALAPVAAASAMAVAPKSLPNLMVASRVKTAPNITIDAVRLNYAPSYAES